MCTLILLYRFLEGYPIVAMHNRYAPSGSMEGPKGFKGKFKVYHPIDLSSKGTWIGFNDKGLCMAVTDQHTDGACKTYRSSELLLMDILTCFSEARDALNYLRKELLRVTRRATSSWLILKKLITCFMIKGWRSKS